MMIIERQIAEKIRRIKGWILLYGRRKTGKSFLVKHLVPHDEYFFIKQDGSIFSGKQTLSYETFLELLTRGINEGKTLVVDEFHRLGPSFYDYLHMEKQQGKLILITSTLHLGKQLLAHHSALLGKMIEVPVGLLSLEETLLHFPMEAAIFAREPITIPYLTHLPIAEVIKGFRYTIPALIGEIFHEEHRQLSRTYEGILRAVAIGKNISSEISSYLFSRRILAKDDPSLIQPYLNLLQQIGLLKRVKVHNKNRYRYYHVSSLIEFYYYADEKYNFSEQEVQLDPILKERLPHLIEKEVRSYIAYKLGLEERIIEGKDFEIDGYLTKFNKGVIALEVKWKERLTSQDLKKVVQNLSRVKAKRKILFTKHPIKIEGIEVWTPKTFKLL